MRRHSKVNVSRETMDKGRISRYAEYLHPRDAQFPNRQAIRGKWQRQNKALEGGNKA